jgi:hypothetical protein
MGSNATAPIERRTGATCRNTLLMFRSGISRIWISSLVKRLTSVLPSGENVKQIAPEGHDSEKMIAFVPHVV